MKETNTPQTQANTTVLQMVNSRIQELKVELAQFEHAADVLAGKEFVSKVTSTKPANDNPAPPPEVIKKFDDAILLKRLEDAGPQTPKEMTDWLQANVMESIHHLAVFAALKRLAKAGTVIKARKKFRLA